MVRDVTGVDSCLTRSGKEVKADELFYVNSRTVKEKRYKVHSFSFSSKVLHLD